MKFFGSSCIHRVVDTDLVYIVFKVWLAVGKVYGNVVVGTDTRTPSCALGGIRTRYHRFRPSLIGDGWSLH